MIKNIKQYAFLIIVIILGILLVVFNKKDEKVEIEEPEIITESTIQEEKEDEEKASEIKVDIKGMVKNPGVYEMDEGARVIDVIEKAGGLLKNAHISFINLSMKVKDEMVIIIYSNEEIEALKEEKIQYEIIEVPCICPDTRNDACITEKEPEEKNEAEQLDTKININKASLEELLKIPGIGESKAKSIITYREANPFETIEDIKQVSGIGDALFEKIKDYIMV